MSTHAQENVIASEQRERDGRPLYAYKVRDSEYERLKAEMREQMPRALRGRADRSFAAMFCMYAAETFAVGMPEGHGPGRQCLTRSDRHPLIRLYTPG